MRYYKVINKAYRAQERADSAMIEVLDRLREGGLDEKYGIQNQAGDGFVIFEYDNLYSLSGVVSSLNELGYFDGRGGI